MISTKLCSIVPIGVSVYFQEIINTIVTIHHMNKNIIGVVFIIIGISVLGAVYHRFSNNLDTALQRSVAFFDIHVKGK
ncbi:MAG: hypothetical protein V1922_04675 [bacterium]